MRKFLLLVFLISLAGCTAALSSHTSTEAPEFTLTIEQDRNDGENLYLIPAVSATTDWAPSETELRVRALKEGDIISESRNKLSQYLTQPRVEADTKVTFPVTLVAAGLTDYQVELNWGKNGVPNPSQTAKLANPQSSSFAEPAAVEMQRPQARLLDTKVSRDGSNISSLLVNDGMTQLTAVVLGVGFIDQFASSNALPQNEERLTLSELGLNPGESQPLSIEVSTRRPAGQSVYQPSLRILSVD